MNMPEGKRTRLKGTVTGVKADKTVMVTVQRRVQHPLYKKYIGRNKRYPAHDEQNRCKYGDLVEIISTRPLSKTKRWAVSKILASSDTGLPSDDEAKETVS
jgi:small subunit ribosomal protein S17